MTNLTHLHTSRRVGWLASCSGQICLPDINALNAFEACHDRRNTKLHCQSLHAMGDTLAQDLRNLKIENDAEAINPNRCLLLERLPAELRVEIYELALRQDPPVIVVDLRSAPPHSVAEELLLNTDRTIQRVPQPGTTRTCYATSIRPHPDQQADPFRNIPDPLPRQRHTYLRSHLQTRPQPLP